jgi:hypothetical protein
MLTMKSVSKSFSVTLHSRAAVVSRQPDKSRYTKRAEEELTGMTIIITIIIGSGSN